MAPLRLSVDVPDVVPDDPLLEPELRLEEELELAEGFVVAPVPELEPWFVEALELGLDELEPLPEEEEPELLEPEPEDEPEPDPEL